MGQITGATGNVGVGTAVMAEKTSGDFNTGLGQGVLRLNIGGARNTAVGAGSMENGTTGNDNTSIGVDSMKESEGSSNAALGSFAMQNHGTGDLNTAVGFAAYSESTSGSFNIAVGSFALNSINSNNNTGVGYAAMFSNTTGVNNVALGRFAGGNVTEGSNNIFIGAGTNGTGAIISNQLNIGNSIYGDLDANLFGFGVETPTERIDATGGNVKADTFISATQTYPDYVFQNYYEGTSTIKEDYNFTSLKTVEEFVKENNHLPGVTSYQEVKDNNMTINLSELAVQSLEKIEELYLHIIAQQKEIEKLKAEVEAIKKN